MFSRFARRLFETKVLCKHFVFILNEKCEFNVFIYFLLSDLGVVAEFNMSTLHN